MKTFHLLLLAALLLVLSLLLYWNTLHHQFVNFDDTSLVVKNRYIKSLSIENLKAIFTPGVVGAYQPFRTLSYAIDYHFWKLNPTGYHLTNILCHAVNTLFVFLIAYVLSKHLLLASLAALLFAVHPIHVEAVAWVSGRRDVLASVFTLCSFFCFLWVFPPLRPQNSSYLERSGWRRGALSVLSCVLFIAGLLTKPSVVILPLLLIIYDLCFVDPPFFRQWRRMWGYLPFFIAAFLITRVFLTVARTSGVVETQFHATTPVIRALTMLRVLGEYVVMLFIPRQLSATYGVRISASLLEPSVLFTVMLFGVIAICMLLAWKRSKLVFLGIAWFFVSLLPVSNIIPIAIIKADRYLYLPSVGFCFVFAWLIVRGETLLVHAAKTRFVRIAYWGLICAILISYAFLTIQRNRDWKDSHTLWAATLETHPDSSIALNNLGLIYAEEGMPEKALALYEQLLALHPEQEHIERVYANIANVYAAQKQFDEAITYYQHALETNPAYLDAYLGLAGMSIALQQYDHAEKIYQQALALEDQTDRVYTQLGNLYTLQEKYPEAQAFFHKALAENPTAINAYNGLGLTYVGSGQFEKALDVYQQALAIDPDAAIIHNSVGNLYVKLEEPDKAITAFNRVLQIEPENVEVRNNLGIVFLRKQQYEDAARTFMTALSYQPDHTAILSNLGMAYVHLGLYDQAIQMYQWALEIDPSLVRTQVLLGDVCLGTGKFTCAREAYQAALELRPGARDITKKLETVRQQETEGE